ncbi:ribonuclease HII [Aurantibacter sp.]|uniref:ribonuclease HII n=1 Tax=Aurantibacter sp. TaxID=2807103 RepID=UPI0035C7C487
MKAFLLSLIFISLFACNTDYKNANPEDFLNKNAQTILRINGLEQLSSNINNSHFLNQLDKTKTYSTLKEKFSIFNYIKTKQPIYVNLFSSEEFSFATAYSDSLVQSLSNKNILRDSVSVDAIMAEKITFNNQNLYVALRDSVIIGANSKEQLKAIYNLEKNEDLLKLLKTTNKTSEISILSNQTTIFKQPIFIDSLLNKKQLTNYLAFDVDLSQENILLNGISKAKDSTKSLINVFTNTIPQENELALITPNNSDGFLSVTYNDFEIFRENLNTFNKKATVKKETLLFDNITEIGVIYNDTNAFVLNTIDTELTQIALQEEQNEIEVYRSIPIYSYSQTDILKNHFSPFINQEVTMYCQIDQFFVFSSSKETLQNIIANYQNKTTLFFKDYYKAVSKQLSSQSSLLQVVNNSALASILNSSVKNTSNLTLDDYKTSAFQFSYDYDFAHFNAVFNKSKITKKVNTISEKFNIKLDHAILNKPQFVKNHVSGKNEIVAQDIKNTLYLISNSGKILWKKDLKDEVLGKIEQVDLYKNGRLQLAFATKKAIYILDRNGNQVKPFPVKLNDNITQPLSVFDYDGKKDYRFLITQKKELLMLDAKGKTVTGFKYKKDNKITSQPKHFRIGSKDYIVFSSKNKLIVLDRVGKTRVTVKDEFNFSDNNIFLNNNKFTFTNTSGELIQVNHKGHAAKQSLLLNKKHGFDASSKTLIYQSENKLTIKNKTIELDFGNYTKPNLFYSNNKIFASTTDLQTQKIYVFDSNAKLLPNFPIFGNATIDLKNTNNLEIITKGDSNSILFYTTN